MEVWLETGAFKMKTRLLPLILLLAACDHVSDEIDTTSASRIARPAFMVERQIDTATYTLPTWERMHMRTAPANIYIGEGGSTPSHALALHIATRDQSDNVAWLGQPCQYLSPDKADDCEPVGATDPKTIAAYNDALNDIRARYALGDINLIGYDSGAAIAARLAATRNDVASLRTIAGTLDEVQDIAPALRRMPQQHFIAAGDEEVPPAIYHNFRQAIGESACVRYALIQDADHRKGWVEVWPKLIKLMPACGPADAATPVSGTVVPPLVNPYAKEAIDYLMLEDAPLPPSPHADHYKK
jgi:pimeloyl-ACP methyl ester carboxylesterase